jgi:hypothetical protein
VLIDKNPSIADRSGEGTVGFFGFWEVLANAGNSESASPAAKPSGNRGVALGPFNPNLGKS